jgi:DNA-binding LytR/AlgR family response regulator
VRIAIVEDEALASNYLKTLLLQQDILVVSTIVILSSVKEATSFLFQNQVDLIFMDIHLGDGKSLEIFEQVQVNSPIIFTTAYDSYAIQVFKQFTIDYILKPFTSDDLTDALLKYKNITKQLNNNQETLSKLTHIENDKKSELKDRFLVHDGYKLKSLELADIAYFFASGKHLFIHTYKNERYIYDDTIKDIITKLDASSFFKVNRKIIINRNAVENIIKHNSQKIELTLSVAIDDEMPILVSKSQISELKSWLN